MDRVRYIKNMKRWQEYKVNRRFLRGSQFKNQEDSFPQSKKRKRHKRQQYRWISADDIDVQQFISGQVIEDKVPNEDVEGEQNELSESRQIEDEESPIAIIQSESED